MIQSFHYLSRGVVKLWPPSPYRETWRRGSSPSLSVLRWTRRPRVQCGLWNHPPGRVSLETKRNGSKNSFATFNGQATLCTAAQSQSLPAMATAGNSIASSDTIHTHPQPFENKRKQKNAISLAPKTLFWVDEAFNTMLFDFCTDDPSEDTPPSNPTGLQEATSRTMMLAAKETQQAQAGRYIPFIDKTQCEAPKNNPHDTLAFLANNALRDSESHEEAYKILTKPYVCRLGLELSENAPRKTAYHDQALLYLWKISQLPKAEKDRLWEWAVLLGYKRKYQGLDASEQFQDLVPFFNEIEKIFGSFGIFMPDIPSDLFYDRVDAALLAQRPEAFFATGFVKKLRETLYGATSRLPLPRFPGGEVPWNAAHCFLSTRRQKLIERLTCVAETADASSYGTIFGNKLLKQWLHRIADAIKKAKKTPGHLLEAFPLAATDLAFIFLRSFVTSTMHGDQQKIRSRGEKESNSHLYLNTRELDENDCDSDTEEANPFGDLHEFTVFSATALATDIGRTLYYSLNMSRVAAYERNHEDEDENVWSARLSSNDQVFLEDMASVTCSKIAATLLRLFLENAYIELPRHEAETELLYRQKCLAAIEQKALVTRRMKANIASAISDAMPTFYVQNKDHVLHSERSSACLLKKKNTTLSDNAELEDTQTSKLIPAFQHAIVRLPSGKKVVGALLLSSRVHDAVVHNVLLEAGKGYAVPYNPMLVPPLPWDIQNNRGAYFYSQPNFVKSFRWTASLGLRLQRQKYEAFNDVAKTVTEMGRVPFLINSAVLHVAKLLWEKQKSLKPEERYRIEGFPLMVSAKELCDGVLESWGGPFSSHTKQRTLFRKQLISQLSSFSAQLATADEFSNAPEIYYPQCLDFRGRVYPLSRYLHHQGNDFSRGLIKFGRGKELGSSGLFWLKVHLAGLCGIEKQTFEFRHQWTEERTDIIKKVARDPLNQEVFSFWSNQEKPWQVLATCIELGNALQCSSPERYITSLPVHQDGTCNGLQHYAALGRDTPGAIAVNLSPNNSPSDVYTAVMEKCKELMNKILKENLENNDEMEVLKVIKENELLTRKVVKRTVMTLCYGVTHYGAVEQITRELEDTHRSLFADQTGRRYGKAIAKLIFASVKGLFNNAMKIKEWLDQVAVACTRKNLTVAWISPAGVPCLQPYFVPKWLYADTPLQPLRLPTTLEPELVDSRKQKAGLPPNFIHSLDASHMLMTSARCQKEGLMFAAVHDSFWTHACDTQRLKSLLAEEFVSLHSKCVLNDFYQSFLKRGVFTAENIGPPPPVGDFDLTQVLESSYFFKGRCVLTVKRCIPRTLDMSINMLSKLLMLPPKSFYLALRNGVTSQMQRTQLCGRGVELLLVIPTLLVATAKGCSLEAARRSHRTAGREKNPDVMTEYGVITRTLGGLQRSSNAEVSVTVSGVRFKAFVCGAWLAWVWFAHGVVARYNAIGGRDAVGLW